MALHLTHVLNPTSTDVTVGSHPRARHHEILPIHIDDTTSDVWAFLAAGCVLLSGDVVTAEQRQTIGYGLYNGQFVNTNEGD